MIEQFKISTDDIGRSLSLYYGCPFKRFDPRMTVPYEIIRNMKKSFLLNDLWVPISWGKSGIDILMEDPKDIRKTDHIRALIKTRKIILHVGIKEDIEKYIRHFFKKQVQSSMAESIDEQDFLLDIDFEEEDEDEEQVEGLDESASQVVKLVDQVLVKAFRDNASDIHIEPSPISKKTTVRFRLDGVCQEYVTVPNSMARGILSRLKIMANLDIAERRLPQDGKIKFHRKGIPPFELRMATLPTAGGYEDAVLRILAKAGAMAIDEMKLSERNLAILRKIITRPYGLILAVGPTGSGKTTTLHAALGHINKPGVKIWTAEDPVEISQEGLRQVEVKPKIGLDFARVMRAFLRADPDVIMIGEMRDRGNRRHRCRGLPNRASGFFNPAYQQRTGDHYPAAGYGTECAQFFRRLFRGPGAAAGPAAVPELLQALSSLAGGIPGTGGSIRCRPFQGDRHPAQPGSDPVSCRRM